jgi:hypothetical protein
MISPGIRVEIPVSTEMIWSISTKCGSNQTSSCEKYIEMIKLRDADDGHKVMIILPNGESRGGRRGRSPALKKKKIKHISINSFVC